MRGNMKRIIFSLVIVFASMTLFHACSEKPHEPVVKKREMNQNEAGTQDTAEVKEAPKPRRYVKVSFHPLNPTVKDTLNLRIEVERGFDLPEFSILWYVNDERVKNGDNKLDLSPFRKGDRIYAEMRFDDGELDPVVSGEILIANSMPEIGEFEYGTKSDESGYIFYVMANAADPDGDEVHVKYSFYVNDAILLHNATGIIDISLLARDDRIYCLMVPNDGENDGKEKTTPAFKVSNRPPRIVSKPPDSVSGELFTYKIAGQDPDGDELVYELVEGPEGMIMMEDTLHWDVRQAKKTGPVRTVVKASDGHGGDATQEFSLSVASR